MESYRETSNEMPENSQELLDTYREQKLRQLIIDIEASQNMQITLDESIAGVGVKFDKDKVRVELLDPLALEGLAKVLTFGAKKYAAHNWRGGISYSRLLGALMRHLFAILRGEDIDPESGLPHVDHIGCCWMFISNMMKTRPDLDDRWKAPE